MRRQLVRNGVLVGLGAMLAIVVSVASAEDPAPAVDEPAKLDRTFENDEAAAPAVPSADMETGVGGSGPVGTQRRPAPDGGTRPDAGVGGSGGAGMTIMEEESVFVPEAAAEPETQDDAQQVPQGAPAQEPAAPPTGTDVRDPAPEDATGASSAAPRNHTNITVYGPNGLSGDFVPTAPEPATATATGTGGSGGAGRPEDAVPHTRIIVYGPNGTADE